MTMSMRRIISEAMMAEGLDGGPLDGGVTKARIEKMADAMMSPRLMSEIKRIGKTLSKNDAWGGPTDIGSEDMDWEEKLTREIRDRAVDAIVVALTANNIKTTTSLKTSARKSGRATSRNLR